ncbi:hypothetical protein Lfu02_73290 [Longispora fulva]|nr:hypothetical protein Lfu02_73290 [Longispora fulva]
MRTTTPYSGLGPRPQAVYRDEPVTVKTHITARGHRSAVRVTWRTGSKIRHGRHRPMAGRFVFSRIRPAGTASKRLHKGRARVSAARWTGSYAATHPRVAGAT